MRANVEVEVVLERHADHVGNGVLRRLGEIAGACLVLLLGDGERAFNPAEMASASDNPNSLRPARRSVMRCSVLAPKPAYKKSNRGPFGAIDYKSLALRKVGSLLFAGYMTA